jgi:toxin YhaV
VFVANGWTVYFHRVFAERYEALLARVATLRRDLSTDEYRQHPTVKLLAQVIRAIRETVPANPDAPEYRLKRDLAKFRRLKGHGLAERYRLFWVFSSRLHVIVFLYLNDESTLRKEGAASDPYEVFRRLLARGEVGPGFDDNWNLLRERG